MIKRNPITFEKKPNFKCKVIDMDEKKSTWVTHAASEDELRQRLEEKGYTIVDIRGYDFSKWKKKTAKASQKAKEAQGKGLKPDFPPFWSELKHYLFELFDGKCAYCESKVLHVASGDVEHYRPKRKVEEDPSHPGYYWLAYDIENLFPCCEGCNRARAKMNHFPVKGTRAHGPEDNLSRENPQLLNPYKDDPKEHLRFTVVIVGKDDCVGVGTVKGITDAGEESRKTYHLNRHELVEKRKKEQEFVMTSFMQCGMDREKRQALIHKLQTGVAEYSAAGYAQFYSWLKRLYDSVEK